MSQRRLRGALAGCIPLLAAGIAGCSDAATAPTPPTPQPFPAAVVTAVQELTSDAVIRIVPALDLGGDDATLLGSLLTRLRQNVTNGEPGAAQTTMVQLRVAAQRLSAIVEHRPDVAAVELAIDRMSALLAQ